MQVLISRKTLILSYGGPSPDAWSFQSRIRRTPACSGFMRSFLIILRTTPMHVCRFVETAEFLIPPCSTWRHADMRASIGSSTPQNERFPLIERTEMGLIISRD